MPNGQQLIWSTQGIYNFLRRHAKGDMKREQALRRLADAFATLNENGGARIAALSLSDARALYQMTFTAELIADQVPMDPNATPGEIGQALRLKFNIAQTRIYLLSRDDWQDILNAHLKEGDVKDERASPIIERHVEEGLLDKDDVPDDFR